MNSRKPNVFTLLALCLLFPLLLSAQELPHILPMREQAALQDQWLEERVSTLLPGLMRKEKIDLWLLISREYNEDPVLKTMLPATWLSARRRTILFIYDPGEGKPLETLAVARYDVGTVFKKAWDAEKQPDQWARLIQLIEERNPKKIGLNFSAHFGHADGLAATEKEELMKRLPNRLKDRVVSAETLAVNWLETRTPSEMVLYTQIMRIARHIIHEGLSEKVIQPGYTTTDDVVWWYRERIAQLGLTAWFHPTVAVQRNDAESFEHLRNFSKRPDKVIIMPGDLLHIDFGITYLGLNTDTQQHAYVLRPGEGEPPAYLQNAFKIGNRLQDLLTAQFADGTTGNQALARALEQAKKEGIKATIYSHPIGYHGHGAGPTIGLWDQQGGVPHTGDYPIRYNTAYSIELNAAVMIPEWNKEIRIMLEEDGFFGKEGFYYLDGRQTELITVPRQAPHTSRPVWVTH